MTYEDNKKKRSTLPVVGCVRAIASDLCFLDDIQLRTLVFVDRKKVLWFFKKSNNSKTKTMETTKEEMIQFLRELQDLQQWLSTNSLYEISLDINFNVLENSIAIYCHVGFFSDFRMNKSVHLYSKSSYEENRTQLNYFVEYAKKLSKYGNRKSESNQTPTGNARI